MWRVEEMQVRGELLKAEAGPRWPGRRGVQRELGARHRGRCGVAKLLACRGARSGAWRRAKLARGGGRPRARSGGARRARARHKAYGCGLLLGSLLRRELAEERGREGGTGLGLRGVATSISTVATMATCARGACPLALPLPAPPTKSFGSGGHGEVSEVRGNLWHQKLAAI